MTPPSIVPILVALLAPAAAPVEPPHEAAPEAVEPAPSDTPDEASDATPEADGGSEAAPDEAVVSANPFSAPPAEPIELPSTPPPPPVVAPPRPPRPIRWRLDLGVNASNTVVNDLGVRAFTERRNLPETGASATFDFRLASSRFFLGGGVAYQHVGREGDAYGSQLTTRLQMHEPQVLGRVSFMLLEGLDAFARVGVGPSLVDMRLRSEGQETSNQRTLIPRVDGRAGMSLYLPKSWLPRKQASRITAGIDIGMGYTWRGKIDVRPTLEQDSDPLRAVTSPWGTLSMHGLSWGMGLFLRVM